MITEKDIQALAALARIELPKDSTEKLRKDLEGILSHFEELNAVDTTAVLPMTGGTSNENVFRADEGTRVAYAEPQKDFPEEAHGFLKTPPVFE